MLARETARVDNSGHHEQIMPKSEAAWCNVLARRCQYSFTHNVDDGASIAVRLGLSKYFMGNRTDVPFS
jgi:hypothetical protein